MSNWESYQGCLIRTRVVAENYYDYKCILYMHNCTQHYNSFATIMNKTKKAFDPRGCVKYFIAEEFANRLPG